MTSPLRLLPCLVSAICGIAVFILFKKRLISRHFAGYLAAVAIGTPFAEALIDHANGLVGGTTGLAQWWQLALSAAVSSILCGPFGIIASELGAADQDTREGLKISGSGSRLVSALSYLVLGSFCIFLTRAWVAHPFISGAGIVWLILGCSKKALIDNNVSRQSFYIFVLPSILIPPLVSTILESNNHAPSSTPLQNTIQHAGFDALEWTHYLQPLERST